MLLTAFLEECWNMGWNGKRSEERNAEQVQRTEGLGFNLCVVPSPKNNGVLNLDKQGRQRWVVFHKGK